MSGNTAAAAATPRKGIHEGAAQSKLMELMLAMGSTKGFDPIPPEQYLTLRDKRYPPEQRLLWWLASKTIRHGHRSPYAVDDQGKELRLKHAAGELNMERGNVRRAWRHLEADGRVHTEGRRLYLNGAVKLPAETKEKRSEVCTDLFPPYLMKQIKNLPPERQNELLTRYEQETAIEAKVLAEAVAAVRSIFDQRKDSILSEFGVKKIREQKRREAESQLVPVLAEFIQRSVQTRASPPVRVGTTPENGFVRTSASLLCSEEDREEKRAVEFVRDLDIHKGESSSSLTLEERNTNDDDRPFTQKTEAPSRPPSAVQEGQQKQNIGPSPKNPSVETEPSQRPVSEASTAIAANTLDGAEMQWAPEFVEQVRIRLHNLATQSGLFEQPHPEAMPLPDIKITMEILEPWRGREIGFLDWLAYAEERRLGEKRKGFGYALFFRDSIACANQWTPDRLLSRKFQVANTLAHINSAKQKAIPCDRCKDSGMVGSALQGTLEFCSCELGRKTAGARGPEFIASKIASAKNASLEAKLIAALSENNRPRTAKAMQRAIVTESPTGIHVQIYKDDLDVATNWQRSLQQMLAYIGDARSIQVYCPDLAPELVVHAGERGVVVASCPDPHGKTVRAKGATA